MLIRSLLPPGFLREHKHLPCALPLQLCFPTPNQQNKCVTRSVTCRGHNQIFKEPGKGAASPTTFHSQTPRGTSLLLQETMLLVRGCSAWWLSVCWVLAPMVLGSLSISRGTCSYQTSAHTQAFQPTPFPSRDTPVFLAGGAQSERQSAPISWSHSLHPARTVLLQTAHTQQHSGFPAKEPIQGQLPRWNQLVSPVHVGSSLLPKKGAFPRSRLPPALTHK